MADGLQSNENRNNQNYSQLSSNHFSFVSSSGAGLLLHFSFYFLGSTKCGKNNTGAGKGITEAGLDTEVTKTKNLESISHQQKVRSNFGKMSKQ